MICRKAIVMPPDANFPSSWCQSQSPRAQNRVFCAHLAFGTAIFWLFEHKIECFVRFCQLDELDERDELNEQEELNELNEQEELNGRVSSVYKKRGWPKWSPS